MGDHSPLMFGFKTGLDEGLVLARWDHLVQSAHLTLRKWKLAEQPKGTQLVTVRSGAKPMLFCYHMDFRRAQETFERDGYISYLDWRDGFMDVYIY